MDNLKKLSFDTAQKSEKIIKKENEVEGINTEFENERLDILENSLNKTKTPGIIKTGGTLLIDWSPFGAISMPIQAI